MAWIFYPLLHNPIHQNLGGLQLKSNAVLHPVMEGHEEDVESIIITSASVLVNNDNVLGTILPCFPYFER